MALNTLKCNHPTQVCFKGLSRLILVYKRCDVKGCTYIEGQDGYCNGRGVFVGVF